MNPALSAKALIFGANVGVPLPIGKAAIISAASGPVGEVLTLDSVGSPDHGGQLTDNTDHFTFVSNTIGASQFNYTVRDSAGNTAHNTITVRVLAAQSAIGSFYASDLQGNLFILQSDTGALTQTVRTTYSGNSITFNDLAINKEGALYGKDTTGKIYKIDATTGVSQIVPFVFPAADYYLGLSFLPDGRLVTAIQTTAGYSVIAIDTTNRVSVIVPDTKGYGMAGGDVKYLPDGFLYWTVVNSTSTLCRDYPGSNNPLSPMQTLVKIDPTTKATTEVGCLTSPNIVGLGFAHELLYGFSGGGDLVKIDFQNAHVTLVNATGQQFSGSAANPALW